MALAEYVSSWSKDPSTKVGAVITKDNNSVVSFGYNGFPVGYSDADHLYADRIYKYKHIIHAELNAIENAKKNGTVDFSGCSIYVYPFISCHVCTKDIISLNFKNIYSPKSEKRFDEKWKDSFIESERLYNESGIDYYYI